MERKNPLSYLGWFGIVGIVGINTGDFLLQLFLVYFIFFIYRWVPADELFWLNVRRAGLRAFIFLMVTNSLAIIFISIIENIGKSLQTYFAPNFFLKLLCILFAISLLYFIGLLLYYSREEKKYLEKSYDKNQD
ncbi:DUF3796 domain-containing protein [Ohessyouella blattaphilus]|uniref:DUF3796 domain-containing protein n=1 Tax=Ohessyouella blattaphilus TaxID=2949333 RepID=A0ABT1EFM5_9FIRM|nr:DUF3796 domain-containing protein [Ohessyouella blattaphilus]MCP1109499.1 DUF3796 domain-containing protein [Ohessyouella blattaphilus]MCR8562893.1 DUF3796 domain-containing protein [Ohessyouella blattaphilus]MDL2250114.1 DUF3796 domain-containing protein [Lachnospiraceae bacterium OttesenSCG-928-J05]